VPHGEALCAELEAWHASEPTVESAELLAVAWTVAYDPIMPQRLYGPHPDASRRAKALQRAEGLLLPLVLTNPGPPPLGHRLAQVLLARAETQNAEAALGLLKQAVTLLDELEPLERESPSVLLTRARLLGLQGKYSRPADNERLQQQVLGLADNLLAHPAHAAAAKRIKVSAHFALAQLDVRGEAELSQLGAAERLAAELRLADPSNDDDWYWFIIVRRSLANALWERGQVADGVAVMRQTAVDGGHPATQPLPVEGGSRRYIKGILERIAVWESNRGNFGAADQAMAAQQIYAASLKVPAEASKKAALNRDAVAAARVALQVALPRGDYAAVVSRGEATLAPLSTLLAGPNAREADRVTYASEVTQIAEVIAEACIHLRRYAAAEAVLRRTSVLRAANAPPHTAMARVWLALAIVRQERPEEAREMLLPASLYLRRQHENRRANFSQREIFARALLVEALTEPPTGAGRAARAAALAEAQSQLETMSAEARQLYNQRVLQGWITQARMSGG
jgi:hypothetical protein